jgi:hypothetical protein
MAKGANETKKAPAKRHYRTIHELIEQTEKQISTAKARVSYLEAKLAKQIDRRDNPTKKRSTLKITKEMRDELKKANLTQEDFAELFAKVLAAKQAAENESAE